ncbi:uncharacterized protein MKZ38_001846 [Zalerion maritima]|uniref:Amino acid transporter transmembrane domain-containing protein n=1 Tax=Zalerion maritima TaxID=339359 RepID=A0AAD5RPV4_9PEZI|nr:uncharacterized protein MKZ38_001846 [Zalerion maritima]
MAIFDEKRHQHHRPERQDSSSSASSSESAFVTPMEFEHNQQCRHHDVPPPAGGPFDRDPEVGTYGSGSSPSLEKDKKYEGQDLNQNVFSGDGSEGGKSYRTMGRKSTIIVLITNQIGLGILSLPKVVQTLGLLPGLITIVGMGILSTYTAYVLLQFYRRYPSCVNIVDMAYVVGKTPFATIVGVGLLIKLALTCASASVTISVAFNTISDHGMCTVWFILFAVLGQWLLCLPRTFKFVSHVGWPSTITMLAAIFIVIISLGIEGPQGAPDGWDKEIKVVGNPDFKTAVSKVCSSAYAWAGNLAFVTYMAEMKDPTKDFVPSLLVLQVFSLSLYVLIAVAVYCFAGQYTTSPALGAAPVLPAKIAYGIVLVALFATGLCFGHTALKFMYVTIMRKLKATSEITKNTPKSWIVWVSCATVFWAVSFALGNAIPIFDSILAISSATFIAWFTFGLSSILWFHLNWPDKQFLKGWKKIGLTVLNVFIICLAVFMNSAGLYAAISDLMEIYDSSKNKIRGPFTCADNGIF